MSKRSCQQFELYASETAVPGGRVIPPADLQAYVDQLRENPYWERNFPNVRRIETNSKRSDRGGSVGWFEKELECGVIDMAPVHHQELVILHECAHVLASARYGSQAHCPWFARTYLELVSTYLPDSYLPLYQAFVAGGIDFEHRSYAPAGIEL